MTRTRKSFRGALRVAALPLAALIVAACGSSGSSSSSGSSNASATPTGAASTPAKITIGYQDIPNGDLVVKHLHWLEQALPKTKVEWKVFQSGGDVNQAVAAGAVDIGLVGSSPVSRGISQSLPYEVPWIHDVIGSAEALVVRKDITSIAGLKGKTVATPLASTSDFSLLAALKDAGVSQQSVHVINAEPDAIYAAWARGDIAGAYVWNPNLAKIIASGGHILVTSADLSKRGQTTYDLAVVTKSFASKYPAALNTWVAQEDRAVKLFGTDQAAFTSAVAAELNLSASAALAQEKGLIYLTAKQQASPTYLGGELGRQIYAQAVFNQKLGQIPSLQPQSAYLGAVDPTAAQQVGAGG